MKKKYAFVTGATGGIAREICKMLVKNQYFIYINARKKEKALSLQKELQAIGGESELLIFDINHIKSATKEMEEMKPIDLFVNNAGILRDNLVYNIPINDWEEVMNTNFYAVDSLYNALDGKLKNDAIIFNISSISGVKPRGGQLPYAMSKRMLIKWTENMARLKDNQKFYSISPGPIITDLIQETKWYGERESLQRIPIGRYGEASEIADFIEMIINNPELIVSGSNVILDGGFTQTLKE